MKILIVCNNAFYKGNGLCTAVLNLRENLIKAGADARIMSCKNPDANGMQPDYPLGHFKFPFFEKLIYANGFRYAAADRKVMKEAIAWADVIHLEEGFPIEAITARMAKKMGKVCVGSYHLFSENILANLGLKHEWILNHTINFFWRKSVYDKCRIVHCPTETVKNYLLERGFKSEMAVISNGISIDSPTGSESRPQVDPYIVLCIGRLSNEKQQTTLLEAMKYSRHSQEIQLHFAGKGPKAKKYRRIAERLYNCGVLKYMPEFGFYNKEELAALSRNAYLYIHCAWVEVEGLSCVEAIREGAVPLIASGPFTATSQFALNDKCVFPEGDAQKLAGLIDWWIEHPLEREKAGMEYASSARNYDIKASTAAIIETYKKASASSGYRTLF